MNQPHENRRGRFPRVIATTLLLGLIVASGALAQAPQPNASPTPAEAPADPLERDTPAGTVRGFIKATSDGNFQRAVEYLDTRRAPDQGTKLAQQLAVVLNRRLSVAALDLVSDSSDGDTFDDLAPNLDRVGVVSSGDETLDILVERVARGGTRIWLFSARTLQSVPAIYEKVRPPWIEQYLWPPLREVQFLGLRLWQWVVLPLALALVLATSRLLSRGLFVLLRPLLFRLTGEQAIARLDEITVPVRVVSLSVVLSVWISTTSLSLLSRVRLSRVSYAVGIVGVTWLLWRVIGIAGQLMQARLRRLNELGDIAVVQLSGTVARVVVVLAGALAILYAADIDLTAALAGVGIGGLALAFAAQKTIENLFGGVTIISDHSARVGDFCKVGDQMGTVEQIGLRSTRIRTLDRTLVSIPNGRMSTQNIENFAVRDQVRFRPTLGLRYQTNADQLRFVLAEIRRMLYEHPMVETESARVRFTQFGSSSLDLDVFAYVRTGDFTQYLEVQEDLLLRIMEIVEASGTAFALPSSTTYLARDSGLDEQKTGEAMAAVKRWREERSLPFPNFRPEQISEFKNTLPYPPPESALATAAKP